jgi:hypothetical protein
MVSDARDGWWISAEWGGGEKKREEWVGERRIRGGVLVEHDLVEPKWKLKCLLVVVWGERRGACTCSSLHGQNEHTAWSQTICGRHAFYFGHNALLPGGGGGG